MKNSNAHTLTSREKHARSDGTMCMLEVVVEEGREGNQGGGQEKEGTPDAERISKSNKANTSDHADAAVGALEQLHAGCTCLKHQFHLLRGGVT